MELGNIVLQTIVRYTATVNQCNLLAASLKYFMNEAYTWFWYFLAFVPSSANIGTNKCTSFFNVRILLSFLLNICSKRGSSVPAYNHKICIVNTKSPNDILGKCSKNILSL